MKYFIFLLLISITACDSKLKESTQITDGTSDQVPYGLMEWCNGLSTKEFYDEEECLWYCRVEFKNDHTLEYLKSTAKARINTCESP